MTNSHEPGPCFFCADLPGAGEKGRLEEAETHHASAARRIRVGDSIGLIDGRGTRAVAVVESVARRTLAFAVRERERVAPAEPSLVVATAVPKGERFRTLIDMLAQIGAAGIRPLVSERGAVKPRGASLERWRRIAIEACKQSRNPWVPDIREPVEVAQSLAEIDARETILFADIEGAGAPSPPPAGRLHLYVGPEGGFTETEKKLLLDRGGRPLKLGGNVLRVETAAIVGAAACLLGLNRG